MVALRKSGLSYREINLQIGLVIPKSTLSYMCRNIVMSEAYRTSFSSKREGRLAYARSLAVVKNKELLNARIDDAKSRAFQSLASDRREKYIALTV